MHARSFQRKEPTSYPGLADRNLYRSTFELKKKKKKKNHTNSSPTCTILVTEFLWKIAPRSESGARRTVYYQLWPENRVRKVMQNWGRRSVLARVRCCEKIPETFLRAVIWSWTDFGSFETSATFISFCADGTFIKIAVSQRILRIQRTPLQCRGCASF